MSKVSGNISVRYAKQSEPFLALGARTNIMCEPHHVVYADEQRVLSWLWNHKDADETGVSESSRSLIFFVDGFDKDKVSGALDRLSNELKNVGAQVEQFGILSRAVPECKLVGCCEVAV